MENNEKTCQTCKYRFTGCKLREAITVSQEYLLDVGFNDEDQAKIASYIGAEDLLGGYNKEIINISTLDSSAKDVLVDGIVKQVMQAVGKYCTACNNSDAKYIDFEFKLPPDFCCNFWE